MSTIMAQQGDNNAEGTGSVFGVEGFRVSASTAVEPPPVGVLSMQVKCTIE